MRAAPGRRSWASGFLGVVMFAGWAASLTLPDLEGEASVQAWPGVVWLQITGRMSCSGVFIRPTVVFSAGRCVARADPAAPTQVLSTLNAGEFAGVAEPMLDVRVFAGAGTVAMPLVEVARVRNYSWVYRPGFHGSNAALFHVDITRTDYVPTAYPIREALVGFPVSVTVVGYGAVNVTNLGVASGAGVHRSSSSRVVEATLANDAFGSCSIPSVGGAFIVQEVNGIPEPMMCVSTGDYGGGLFLNSETTPGVVELAGVAAQGDSYPCSARKSYFTSTLYRRDWIVARVRLFETGGELEEITCPSPSPSPSPLPSIRPSRSPSPTPSTSPSPIPPPPPPREVNWAIIITLLAIIGGFIGLSLRFWLVSRWRIRSHERTKIAPAETKDPTLESRLAEQRAAREPKAGSAKPPDHVHSVEELRGVEAERAARRDRREGERTAQESRALAMQREKREMQRRAAKAAHETRTVDVGKWVTGFRFSSYVGTAPGDAVEPRRGDGGRGGGGEEGVAVQHGIEVLGGGDGGGGRTGDGRRDSGV